MRAADLGEFALIERLARRLRAGRRDVVAGIGDDAAAIACSAERLLLATTDAQVAGTHFLLDRWHPERVGRKLVAVNVSDIAAMGGLPTHALSSLVVPPDINVAELEALYDGIAAEAAQWGIDVVGGNVSRGAQLVADLTLLGEVEPASLLRRSGARVGDRLLVTGSLGTAAAGLHLLDTPDLAVPPEARREALDALELPVPRVREARVIVGAGADAVHAAINVSDGLAADLAHLCAASGVGVRVEQAALPIAESTRVVAQEAGTNALDWALAGGEDYQIVFAVPPHRVGELAGAVREATGTLLTAIGTIVAAERGRLLVLADGSELPLPPGGWQHF